MIYFIALLLFVLGYSVSKFLLSKVAGIAELAEILSIVIGALIALVYLGVF